MVLKLEEMKEIIRGWELFKYVGNIFVRRFWDRVRYGRRLIININEFVFLLFEKLFSVIWF